MLREEPVRAETGGAALPRALEGGSNGVRATFESPRERPRRFLRFHMVLVLGQHRPPRPVRPPILPAPVAVGAVHVEAATYAGRPSKQIGRTARARGRGRFSQSRNIKACIIESREVCTCVCVVACVLAGSANVSNTFSSAIPSSARNFYFNPRSIRTEGIPPRRSSLPSLSSLGKILPRVYGHWRSV